MEGGVRLLRFLSVLTAIASATTFVAATPFIATGNMNDVRAGHVAAPLPNGKVLVAGGKSAVTFEELTLNSTAELYDPATGEFTRTGSLQTGRTGATATPLGDGKVLIIGGSTRTFTRTGWNTVFPTSVELYDPSSGMFVTNGATLGARGQHAAALLSSGKVLIVGGLGGSMSVPPELYDPMIGASTSTGTPIFRPDIGMTATRLANDKVLVVGSPGSLGLGLGPDSQLYDPATNSFEAVASDLLPLRTFHSATRLANGKVLIAGGVVGLWTDNSFRTADAALFDPLTNSFTATGQMRRGRSDHVATLLSNGNVLITGGITGPFYDKTYTPTAEMYDIHSGTFSDVGDMTTTRDHYTATLLSNGKVLLAGGLVDETCLRSAELYAPADIEPIVSPALVPVMSNWSLALLAGALVGAAIWRSYLG